MRANYRWTAPYPAWHSQAVAGLSLPRLRALQLAALIGESGSPGLSPVSLGSVSGFVMTCEIDLRSAAVARKYFAKSPHGSKIEIRMGPARDTLRDLTGPFDLIFIDADKVNYINYYQRAVELVAANGVILIDNVLWSGDVLLQPPPDRSTAVIQELNRLVASDPRVTAVLVTIRDGVLVVRPKGDRNETS